MADALKVIHTSKAKVDTIAQKYGQLIIVEDTREIIFDGDERVIYRQIITVPTDEFRRNIQYPIMGGFYFVKSTLTIWTYDGTWVQVTRSGKDQVVFDDVSDFPVVGDNETLYVASNLIYRYYDGSYHLCSSSANWEVL